VKRIYLAFVLTGVATTMLGPLIPAFEARWQLDDARAGLLFVSEFLASVALAALAPALGRAIGFRRAVALGLAVVAAGIAACNTHAWPVAIAAVGLYGCGLGIVVTGSNLAIAAASEGRGSAGPLLWLNMCWSIGAVAAPWLVASLRDAFLPVTATAFLALALVVGIGGANPRFDLAHPSKAAGIPHWKFAAMLFLYVGVETAISGWVSTYATRSVAGALWAILPSVFWFAILAGRALSPALLHRIPPRVLAPIGLSLGFIGGTILLAAGGAAAMLIGTALAGLGFAPIYPVVVAEYADLSAGAVSGLVFSAAGFGGAAIPPLVGAISTATHSLRLGLMSAVLWIPVIIALHRTRTPNP
jgi:MFS transporter, FHS family, glucose/mannose:H+ symporter